jgi:hypothetical protein
MERISLNDKIIHVLSKRENTPLTAAQISDILCREYKKEFSEKEAKLLVAGRVDLRTQIRAEIGSQKNALKKKTSSVHWHNEPKKTRVYWYGKANLFSSEEIEPPIPITPPKPTDDNDGGSHSDEGWDGNEESLYPIFNNYLHANHALYPYRIDERRSGNTRGSGGNEWLHPDIVALDPIDSTWEQGVQHCANQSHGEMVNLWSFEVKKAITLGRVRRYYFQAVSNSSWANYGYLVATSIEGNGTLQELKMLHALHGIGVIILNANEPDKTEIILPATKREKVDWVSVNRLSKENPDFKEFVANTSDYLQTRRLKKRDWHIGSK